MYEEIVAQVRRTSEAAVRESQERVDLATSKSEQADKQANEASKAVGERWTNRINAMRRRAADRTKGQAGTEMRFGHEDGPHPNDTSEGDELVSLVDTTPSAAAQAAPQFGIPEELAQQPAPTFARPPSPEPARYMQFGPEYEEDHRTPPPPPAAPPTRRAAAPSRRPRPRDDDDDDYSSQSWLEGR